MNVVWLLIGLLLVCAGWIGLLRKHKKELHAAEILTTEALVAAASLKDALAWWCDQHAEHPPHPHQFQILRDPEKLVQMHRDYKMMCYLQGMVTRPVQ